MHVPSGEDGLRQGITSMLVHESRLDERLARLSAETGRYLEAPTVIAELHALVKEHEEVLQAHLDGLEDSGVPPVEPSIGAAFAAPPEGEDSEQQRGTVAMLRAAANAITETAFGYEVLHGLAHRFFQVPTANLADQLRRDYLQASKAVHRAVGDVLVQELQDGGHACRCECPACGPGICLCWHVHLEPGEQGPGLSAEGFVVRAPRSGSNAEQAGLRHGDVIVAVGGHEIKTYEEMVEKMREFEPGEAVELRVRRGPGEPEELIVRR
jgi:PDZ domain